MQAALAERPEPRRWKAWVVLERDETFYRVSFQDPATDATLQGLIALGWIVVPVEIREVFA